MKLAQNGIFPAASFTTAYGINSINVTTIAKQTKGNFLNFL